MKTKVGIIGAAGYTAGELIRLLLNHEGVTLELLQSESQAGLPITKVHQDLIGETDLVFEKNICSCDVYFLCKGHGESAKILAEYPELLNAKVIDLSQDFRLAGEHDFVYGLPELDREEISKASHIANPGCFATSIQLGLLPAFANQLVKSDVHTSGITGSTGAGQSFSLTSHYSWRNSNASVYKALTHQHLQEIGETVIGLDVAFSGSINFIPYRGAFTRGIITTSYFDTDATEAELIEIYQSYYQDALFTHVTDVNPDVKGVVNTSKALVYPKVINGKAVVISVIDNLLKGASGQAVQNMNLVMEFPENQGLQLKSIAF
jgi:N-acetyl-gamma-glutamyl-phosphate reductase